MVSGVEIKGFGLIPAQMAKNILVNAHMLPSFQDPLWHAESAITKSGSPHGPTPRDWPARAGRVCRWGRDPATRAYPWPAPLLPVHLDESLASRDCPHARYSSHQPHTASSLSPAQSALGQFLPG